MRLKLDTMTGTGRAITNTPLNEHTLPTSLPGIVAGTISPYLYDWNENEWNQRRQNFLSTILFRDHIKCKQKCNTNIPYGIKTFGNWLRALTLELSWLQWYTKRQLGYSWIWFPSPPSPHNIPQWRIWWLPLIVRIKGILARMRTTSKLSQGYEDLSSVERTWIYEIHETHAA